MSNVLEELKEKSKEETKEEVIEEKREGFIFKSKVPNLYLYVMDIRFRKGEYVTTDEKEAKALRKIAGIEEVKKWY